MTVAIADVTDAKDDEVFHDFDASNWLGYAVNLLTTGSAVAGGLTRPADLRDQLLSRDVRAVLMSKTTVDKHVSDPSNSNFKVPDNISLFEDDRLGTGVLMTTHSGSDVVHSLSSDTNFSASYFGVTASGGVHYDTSSHYASDSQYAFFSSSITAWTARIDAYTDYLNPTMVDAASQLPSWEKTVGEVPSDDTVAAYRKFFNKYGTHVVRVTNYGFRYRLEVQQSNASSDSSSAFGVNVSVKYMENSVSEDVKTKNNYSDFDNQAHATVDAIGGSGALATKLRNDPANVGAKHAWLDDLGKRPHEEGITSVELMSIGSVLGQSTKDPVSALARTLDFALFDLQRSCVRRLILKVDASVANCTLTLGAGAVFDTPPNSSSALGFFHRPDVQAENVVQYSRRSQAAPPWPIVAIQTAKVAFTCTIRAGRNGKVPIAIKRDQDSELNITITMPDNKNIHFTTTVSSPLELEVERYLADNSSETLRTLQLANSSESVHTDEQTDVLDLAASKDFWWTQ